MWGGSERGYVALVRHLAENQESFVYLDIQKGNRGDPQSIVEFAVEILQLRRNSLGLLFRLGHPPTWPAYALPAFKQFSLFLRFHSCFCFYMISIFRERKNYRVDRWIEERERLIYPLINEQILLFHHNAFRNAEERFVQLAHCVLDPLHGDEPRKMLHLCNNSMQEWKFVLDKHLRY